MLIEADHVTHTYGQGPTARTVLTDVSVRLTERRVGVVGHNGSGKSTFARMINGLIIPTKGTVTVDGRDTASQAKEIRKHVGFVFTDPDNQIIMPTVAEDIAFGLRRSKLPKDEIARRVQVLLDRFGLAGHADHPAHLLSGGQKQLLALASVLVTEPDILVMDEPTTLLDLRNRNRIRDELARLDQQLIIATHDLELAQDAERVIVVDGGRIVADGPPDVAIGAYVELVGR